MSNVPTTPRGRLASGEPLTTSRYKTLHTWSLFLIALGVLSMLMAAVGVTSWAITVEGIWETLGVVLFGAPIVLLLAAWPIALGQALRAIADIGDALSFDPAAVAASHH